MRKPWWATGEGVTLGGGLVNIALGFVKAFAGMVGGSGALMADALHSFSDLATDVIVLVGYRLGRMPEDEDHPYGHGKMETLSTLVMGLIVAGVGVGIAGNGVAAVTGGQPDAAPGAIALWAALISILAKEGLFRWTAHVACDSDSRLILSNAWHHRTDAFSSMAALAGVAGARWGWWWADPLAAVVVGGFILKVGWELGWPAYRDLTDASVEEEQFARIGAVIDSLGGVQGHKDLRVRRAGASLLVDVDVLVAPELNVVQGHDVAARVRRTLIHRMKSVRDVMVHVEPMGFEDGVFCMARRKELIRAAAELARTADGVLGIHGVRVVPMETGYLLNLDIEVDPKLTVRESHDIAHEIKTGLRSLADVADAVIHVDIHGEG